MCEDPKRGYSLTDERLVVDTTSYSDQTAGYLVPATDPFPFVPNIDLRGRWKQPGKEELDAKRPKDLVDYDIRVPEHAIVATPTWGIDGLAEYRQAVQAAENVLFDITNHIEG